MYRSILVPIDLDVPESWEKTISTASSLVKCFEAEATICSIVSDKGAISGGEWMPISVEHLLFDARARLEGLVARARCDRNWKIEVTAGTVAAGILEIAERVEADLILLVSHQPSIIDHLHAATAVRVASRAPCSVLIARKGFG
jgi:nucleotide-binding universal stress UspA family protein